MKSSHELLREIEALAAQQRHSGRMMLKALRHQGDYGTLHKPRPTGQGFDLLKAESALRRLEREGALTDDQAGEAWRRLNNLRPTATLRLT